MITAEIPVQRPSTGPAPVLGRRAFVEQIMGMPISIHVRATAPTRRGRGPGLRALASRRRRVLHMEGGQRPPAPAAPRARVGPGPPLARRCRGPLPRSRRRDRRPVPCLASRCRRDAPDLRPDWPVRARLVVARFQTGIPVDRAGSMTVTGPDLVWADIWATAAWVDPSQAGRLMATRAPGYTLIAL